MSDHFDLIIVGGGIGGSALAAVMGKAGYRVLLLEKSLRYEDHVRGEWIAPWGVRETKRVGLYETLVAAGGHHVKHHITYDETRPVEVAEAASLPLNIFFEDVPGPLSIRHPVHCQALFDQAMAAGAQALRGVTVTAVGDGASPSVSFTVDGEERTATARLIVGADGRTSQVRRSAGIRLFQDKPHHWFAGLLVDGAEGWDEHTQAIGTEGNMGFLAFPQGNGRVRLYGGYPLSEAKRFAGADGAQRFLEAFNVRCSPKNRFLANGRPVGPLMSYYNNDSWTDEPFTGPFLLIGDAAGWNDPINGLGLSITYRDVRIVSDLMRGADDWSPALFAPYAEERRERMRRLRFVARLAARIDMEFGDEARGRRKRFLERLAEDHSWGRHLAAIMAGPESSPAEVFTADYAADILGHDKEGIQDIAA